MSYDHFALTTLSPVDGRYRSHLTQLAHLFSEFSLIKHRVTVEIEYLLFLSRQGVLPKVTAAHQKQLRQISNDFNVADAEAVKNWEAKTKHDVKAVEYFLRHRLEKIKSPVAAFVHLGLTSEDTNSLSYSLMLQAAQQQVIAPRLKIVLQSLANMALQYAVTPMLARTHGQPAVPTTMGKEMINMAIRLVSELQLIEAHKIEAKVTGAVGNFNAVVVAFPKTDWLKLSRDFVTSLGLQPQLFTTQCAPAENYTQLFASLVRVNLLLLDLNQDIWRYISDGYLVQKLETGQVGSSTMPHKVNPIDFENSEGNLGLANALLQHLIVKLPVSRLQRDLSDSTVKRSIGIALGYCDLAYQSLAKGLPKLSVNETKLTADLNAHWEVLTEAIQVTLRAHGDSHGYEKLQKVSQGKSVTQKMLHDFIASTSLPASVKKSLTTLQPTTYIGLAPQLTKQGLKTINRYLQGT